MGFQPGPARPQTTYLLGYQYAGTRPHAVSHLDEARQGNLTTPRDMAYDLDGNQVGWTFRNGTKRVETWNEEDRLRQVADQGHVIGQYRYNAESARTHSFADGDETIYPSQYLSIKNGMVFTQHIYAGEERIASKVNADSLNNPTTLWYHPDHLQSTQFVSTSDQTLVQHIEYFASGETWKEESTDAVEPFRPAYLFSGKELDTKTGFYYYGARYYDPQVQNWQSTDPMLASYVKTGGIAAPRNLGLYSYSWNNPLVIRDPDGRKIVFAKTASPEFKAEFQRAVTYLQKHGASKMIDDLQNRSEEITLVEGSGGNAVYHSDKRSIEWNPHAGAWATGKGGKRSPANKLSHEADHAMADLTEHDNYLKRKEDKTDNKAVWKNAEEKRVILGSEKDLADKTGEGVRKSHWSDNYRVNHADEAEPADKNAKPPRADEK
jgi:RHS repeat-associated protein